MPKSPKRSRTRTKDRLQDSHSSSKAQGPNLVVRIELRNHAFVAPSEVFAVQPKRGQNLVSHSLSVVGVAEIEYAHPCEEVPKKADATRLLLTGGIPGIDDAEQAADAAGDEGGFSEIENLMVLERTKRRTRRLYRSADCWSEFFDPLTNALKEAIEAVPPGTAGSGSNEGRRGAQVFAGIQLSCPAQVSGIACAKGLAYGYGHPEIRHIQRLARSTRFSQAFTGSAEVAISEFLHQCQFSFGTLAVDSAVEMVRVALVDAATVSTSLPRGPNLRRWGVTTTAGVAGIRDGGPLVASHAVAATPVSGGVSDHRLSEDSSMFPSDSVTSYGRDSSMFPSNSVTSCGRDSSMLPSNSGNLLPARLSIFDEDDDEVMNAAMSDGTDPARQRAALLQSLQSSLMVLLEMSGATRAESPDIQIQLLELSIADVSQEMFLARNKLTSSMTRMQSPRRPSRRVKWQPSSPGSAGSAGGTGGGQNSPKTPPGTSSGNQGQASQQSMSLEASLGNLPDSKEISGDRDNPTQSGARRLQFWDGFFSYRELGAVSREIAANQLAHDADSDEDSGVPSHYTLTMHSKRPMVGAQRAAGQEESVSPFSPKAPSVNTFTTSSSTILGTPRNAGRGAEDTVSAFPALGRRRKHPDVCALRRPPGATAEPPARTPRQQAPVEDKNCNTGTTGLPRNNGKGLPPLVLAAQNTLAARSATAELGTQSNDAVSTAEKLCLPQPSGGPEPLVLPMFMGGTTTQKLEEGSPLPFVNNGVGFELQPLASIQAKMRNPQKSSTIAGKNKQTDSLGRRQSSRATSPGATDAILSEGDYDLSKQRCQYCVYHGTPAFSKAPMIVWQRQASIRALQKQHHSPMRNMNGQEPKLCAACGGDFDTPFHPRPLQSLTGDSFFAEKTSVAKQLHSSRDSMAGSHQESVRSTKRETSRPRASINSGSVSITAMAADMGTIGSPSTASEAKLESGALGMEEKRRHGAAHSFGLPRRVLSENLDVDAVNTGGVYFIACERNKARPLADAAAALMESGALNDSSSRFSSSPESGIVISMRGADLDDKGLSAFIDSLTQKGSDFAGGGIHIDFARNRLTDPGVQELFGSLEEPLAWAKRLESVDLARNRLLTAAGLEPLCDLLAAEKLPRLRCLRLGGIELPDGFSKRLFNGIDAAASSNLEELDISFMGLGRSGPMGAQAAAALVRQCQALCTLDVSGNHLQFEALAALGLALSEAGSAQTVHVAHNTGNWPHLPGVTPASFEEYSRARLGKDGREGGPFPPVQCAAACALCEYIPRVHNLRLLDLRDSQVDPRCAFMLANVLSVHQSVESVLLDGNPLGQYGVRALLSAAFLATPPAGSVEGRLSLLSIDQCMEDSMLALDTPPVSLADPSGSYTLDLRDTWARAAIQYCLKRWHECRPQLSFEQAFPYMELDGKAFKDISQNSDGMWDVPALGILSFVCLLPSGEAADNENFRVRPQDRHRRVLSASQERRALRVAAVCRAFTSLSAFIHALSADFWLRGSVVKTLLAWLRGMGAAGGTAQGPAADALFDSLATTEDESDLLDVLMSTRMTPARSTVGDARSTLDFIVCNNPTGHYVLNLARPSERLAGEDLLCTNAWEVEMAKAQGMPDLSQTGNYQCFRNEALDGSTFAYHSDWMLPTKGHLEFDMAVPRRPARSFRSLPEESFQRLIDTLTSDSGPVPLRILCLWRVSPSLCLTCQQVLTIYQVLAREASGQSKRGGLPQPLENLLLAVLFFRIKDYQNIRQVLFKSPGPFSNLERIRAFEQTLGVLNMADPLQIHNQMLNFRLDVYEERQLCRMLLAIAYVEGGRTLDPKSFAGCAYGPDSSSLRTMSAPPERWVKSTLPLHGVLKLNYICEAEGNVRVRKQKAHQICGWEL